MATATPGYIGPYRLLNVVHTSQTCRIWQAHHDGKRRLFAVKTPVEKFLRDRETVGYLRWEYVVGVKLSHERIVRAYEFDTDRGSPYLALEWFSAPNMKQRLREGIEKIAYLLAKIIERAAEGLAYLHSRGWVHRDVKPDNFLVSDDAEVKLIDFALARRSKRGLAKLLARRSRVQGTRSYISPEQLRGKPLDIRADIYSFGCTIYHLICGRPPFTGASEQELLTKHLKAPPPSLTAVDENIAPEFAQLVRRTMAKDPAARPQSVDDFLTEFRMNRVFRTTPRRPEKTPNK